MGPRHWQAPPSDARPRQCLTMPPPPPRRPVLTVLTFPRAASGVACKPKAMDVCWAAWGRDGSPARLPRPAPQGGTVGAGSGPELSRVDRHQRCLMGRGSVGQDLSLARLLGGRLALLIASSARLRWPGFTGSGAAWLPPLRVGPGQQAGHTGRPTG